MRVLIVSDIHANIVAFDAVLEDAGSFDMIWSLGDIVGYGPEPNACIRRLLEYPQVSIAGNHDWAVLGKLSLAEFNSDARIACFWTREELSACSRDFLDTLPETYVWGDFTLAHGSPRHPIWEYLFYITVAEINFHHFETQVCLVGHTHMPVIFQQPHEEKEGSCRVLAIPDEPLSLAGPERYIINPGGVGQPRDGDPRAAYALLDTQAMTLTFRRVEYDVALTQEQMRRAGLPPRLVARLSYGW